MVLIAVLLALAYSAGERGLADLVAQETGYEIDRWRAGKLVPDVIKLNALQAGLHQARSIDPGNPNLIEDLGRFYAARVERGQAYDADVRTARQQSLGYFRQAVDLRPTSGHAWVDVALMKLRLGEIDEEFSQSLQQAFHRSPWEPQVQLIAIEVGLASWPALSPASQQTIRQAIHSQAQWKLANQKPLLTALLKRYNRLDLVCLLEAGQSACGAS